MLPPKSVSMDLFLILTLTGKICLQEAQNIILHISEINEHFKSPTPMENI